MPSHPVPELRRSHSGEELTASAPVVESIAFSSHPSPAAAASGRAAGAFLCPHCGGAVNDGTGETFDDVRKVVVAGKVERPIGPVRWGVLRVLREHFGMPVTKEQIASAVYGAKRFEMSYAAIPEHIARLRHDLTGTPYRIVTRHWYGYVLERFA